MSKIWFAQKEHWKARFVQAYWGPAFKAVLDKRGSADQQKIGFFLQFYLQNQNLKRIYFSRTVKRCDGSDGKAEDSGLKGPAFKPWPT